MTFKRLLPVIALVLLSANLAFADGLDGHVKIGGAGGGSPSCATFQGTTDGSGLINGDCAVIGATVTSITFAVLPVDTFYEGVSAVQDPSLSGWSVQCTNGPSLDFCTLTAPTTAPLISDGGTPVLNDHDCDADDFVLGIPGGCDITFTTPNPSQNFASHISFDVSTNNNSLAPLPEPATLTMLMMGLLALPFVRRKFARS